MATTITAKPNQSMSDVIIMATGSTEAGGQFCSDNNVALSDVPVVGTTYQVSDEAIAAAGIGGVAALQYLVQRGVTIGTLGVAPASLGVTVVLKPVMKWVVTAPVIPATLGYWQANFEADAGFVNVNALGAAIYPSAPNTIQYTHADAPDGVGLPLAQNASSLMTAKDIPYHVPWTAGHTDAIVFSNLGATPSTATFLDVKGNEALCAPVVFLAAVTQNVDAYLIADIAIDIVSANSSSVTLRLTKSHAVVPPAPITGYVMGWIGEAGGGAVDPGDPTNLDKTFVTFAAGLHTIGVSTQYTDATDGVAWISAMTMVILVG